MRCQACGFVQMVAPYCVRCGAAQQDSPTPKAPPSGSSTSGASTRRDISQGSVTPGGHWKIGGEIGNQAVREYIGNNVDPGEEIVATLLGVGEKTSIGALFGKKAGAALGGDYLLVTDRKVVVIKSGVGTWSTGAFGVKAKTFLYDHIASVDVSRGLIFGDIEIVSAGMVEKGTGGFFTAASRDSVVQFEKEYFDEVAKLAAKIRTLAEERRMPSQAPRTDIPDQIKKLAELKEAGILTEEEFADKKKRLLDKM